MTEHEHEIGTTCRQCGEAVESPGIIVCLVCGGDRCRKCCPGGYQLNGSKYYSVKQCSECTPESFRQFIMSQIGA